MPNVPEALRASSLWQGPADAAGGQIGSGKHQVEEGGRASSLMQRGTDSTSRVSCGSVYEYLATRSPRNVQHLRFSGSRLGARDKAAAAAAHNEHPKEVKVTPSSIMYQRTAAEYGKHTKKKKHMTPEEAREYLEHAQHNPLKPPRTHWESDSMRQAVIDSFQSEVRPEDAPGGSWVLRPGTMPPARAMIRAPDKMTAVTVMNPDRRKLLSNLRWQLYVKNIFTHDQLFAIFRQIDPELSNHVPLSLFYEIVKSFDVELTAPLADMLEQMFCSAVKPGQVDYENFVYILMDSTEHVPKPRTDILGGAEAVVRNRSSSIFSGLNSLRPKSRSGRFHTFTDMRNSMERPLVIRPGIQTTRGMYQFMSDREMAILHSYRDRDPLRNTYKPDYVSPEVEPADLPGRSLPKRVPTPNGLKRPSEGVSSVAIDPNDSYDEKQPLSEKVATPSKARGRTVDFLPTEGQDVSTPAKGGLMETELRSPNNVEDAFTNYGYYVQRSPSSSPKPGAKPGAQSPRPGAVMKQVAQDSEIAIFTAGQPPETGASPPQKAVANQDRKPASKQLSGSTNQPRVKAAAMPVHMRPPAWDVAWRHEVRAADMLTKLAQSDPDGLNQPSGWDSTNQCNKDIPGGPGTRAELKETLAMNQKMNASKRQTNWSYAHGGNELEPIDWRSSTQDQMLFRERLRTPKKHAVDHSELRTPPWSVAERHEVHLMKYNHRLVGLRRPEPLARA